MGENEDFEKIPDSAVITTSKSDLIDFTAVIFDGFIEACYKMAAENWTESSCEQLERLFNAVLEHKPYAPPPEE